MKDKMMKDSTHTFETITLNLQQGIIRVVFDDVAPEVQSGITNQVVAIYSHHKNLLLVAVEWRDQMEAIRAACPMQNFRTKFADHFHIDSWDKKIDND